MNFKHTLFFLLLLVFSSKAWAQPITTTNAVFSSECPPLQNVQGTINYSTQTFNLTYIQISGVYIVWDLYQETPTGDVLVNYGASTTTVINASLNSSPANGDYYVKAYNVCTGGGTYMNAAIISAPVRVEMADIGEDDLIAYLEVPTNSCDLLELDVFKICANSENKDFANVRNFVFGCDHSNDTDKEEMLNKFAIFIDRHIDNSNVHQTETGFVFAPAAGDEKRWFSGLVQKGMKDDKIPICREYSSYIISIITPNSIFPNPTTGDLTINVQLPQLTPVDIRVINAQGQVVRYLTNNDETYEGNYQATFDVSALPNGFYLLETQTSDKKTTHKFLKN
jgi:Secretion system C-terminal sorting domain